MATPTTLPATFVAGNVLTAAQLNDLRGAFRILQVVTATSVTSTSTTSTTYVTSGLAVTITPSSSSSKILIMATTNGRMGPGGGESYVSLFRGTVAGTNLGDATYGFQAPYIGAVSEYNVPFAISYIDSPATTSATTYTLGMRIGAGSGQTITAQTSGARGSIIVMEISA